MGKQFYERTVWEPDEIAFVYYARKMRSPALKGKDVATIIGRTLGALRVAESGYSTYIQGRNDPHDPRLPKYIIVDKIIANIKLGNSPDLLSLWESRISSRIASRIEQVTLPQPELPEPVESPESVGDEQVDQETQGMGEKPAPTDSITQILRMWGEYAKEHATNPTAITNGSNVYLFALRTLTEKDADPEEDKTSS